jgi:hypothetical protein
VSLKVLPIRSQINSPAELLERIKNPVGIKWQETLLPQAIDFQFLDITCQVDLHQLFIEAGFELNTETDYISCPYSFIATEAHFQETFSAEDCQFSFLTCENAIFGNKTDFSGAKFGDNTCFDDATFGDNACFDDAIFGNKTNFSGVTFGEHPRFVDTVFGNNTNFIGAELGYYAEFRNAKFGNDVDFWAAQFEDRASFDNAKFGDNACFVLARFGDNVDFTSATFGNSAFFNETVFIGRATFNKLKHRESGSKLIFRNLQFFTTTRLYFEFVPSISNSSNEFSEILFENFRLENDLTYIYLTNLTDSVAWQIVFDDCKLHLGNVQLEDVNLDNHLTVTKGSWRGFRFTSSCKFPFTHMPWLFLPQINLFCWESFQALPDEAKVQSSLNINAHTRSMEYAMLKTNAQNHGNSQLAHEFYAWQMWWSLKDNPRQFWKWVYYLTSLFGLSVGLPFSWLLLSLFVFYGAYCLIVGYPLNHLGNPESVRLGLLTLAGINPLNYSLDLELININNSQGQAITITLFFAIQRIIALYLYFQMGVAIRGRIKS